MKFIVDAQLPKALSDFIKSKGIDSVHTLELLSCPINQKINFLVVFLFIVAFSSCGVRPGEIVKKELPAQNTPSHIFEIPYEKLKDTIPSLFTFEKQYENEYLERFFFYYSAEDEVSSQKHLVTFKAETSSNPIFSNDYFQKPNTKSDIYLTAMGNYWRSPVYYVKEKPLLYHASFVCKLKRLDEHTTQLTVQAENPVVVNGTDGFGAHGYVANVQKVAPTSIEEYTLLLFIAEQLKEKGLPPIHVP